MTTLISVFSRRTFENLGCHSWETVGRELPPRGDQTKVGRLGLNQNRIKLQRNLGGTVPGGKTLLSSEAIGGSPYRTVGTNQSWTHLSDKDFTHESGPRADSFWDAK